LKKVSAQADPAGRVRQAGHRPKLFRLLQGRQLDRPLKEAEEEAGRRRPRQHRMGQLVKLQERRRKGRRQARTEDDLSAELEDRLRNSLALRINQSRGNSEHAGPSELHLRVRQPLLRVEAG